MPAAARLRLLLPLLAGALVAAVTLALGNWQVRRAEEKQALQAVLDAAAQRPALVLDTLAEGAGVMPGQRVRLEGEWLPAAGIFLDNRTHAGRAGYQVLMPLRLADASGVVLVNRGWVPAGADRAILPVVPAGSGRVTLEGRAQIPEAGAFTLARDGEFEQGRLWQVLDIARLAARTDIGGGVTTLTERPGLPLCGARAGERGQAGACFAPWLVLQTSAAADGLVRDWPAPSAGVERHHGYAFQWYALAALATVLSCAYARRLFLRRPDDERKPRLAGR
ncbi:SURF1 family protein [Thauera butanivorans]|uniref:SURF1 family protein n=1 Tax=Thauera butanivorans TaxID=86174 RepID=UPI003AB4BE6C